VLLNPEHFHSCVIQYTHVYTTMHISLTFRYNMNLYLLPMTFSDK